MTDVLKPPSLSRRHFLIGTGGFTLAVPFLSSLLPRGTKADGSVQRRLIALGTDHGGVFPTNLYPARPSDWTTQEFHPGGGDLPRHVIGSGPLVVDRAGGQATLSRCLTAPEALLTPTLAGKMNFLGGLSITTYLGHTRGMMLGNFGANDQGTSLHSRTMATIDQIVAKSPGFALSPAKERSFNFAMNYGGGSGIRHAASADTVGGGSPTPWIDPQGPDDPEHRQFKVVRGGSWNEEISQATAANRSAVSPENRELNVGFRVVRLP